MVNFAFGSAKADQAFGYLVLTGIILWFLAIALVEEYQARRERKRMLQERKVKRDLEKLRRWL